MADGGGATGDDARGATGGTSSFGTAVTATGGTGSYCDVYWDSDGFFGWYQNYTIGLGGTPNGNNGSSVYYPGGWAGGGAGYALGFNGTTGSYGQGREY